MYHSDQDSMVTFDIVDAHLMLHYGVKGMKWGKRKKPDKTLTKSFTGLTPQPPYDYDILTKRTVEGGFEFTKSLDGGPPIPIQKGKGDKWHYKEIPGKMVVEVVFDGEEYNIDPRMTQHVPFGTIRLKRSGAKGEGVPVIKYPDGSWKTPPQLKRFEDFQNFKDRQVRNSFIIPNTKGAIKNFKREATNNIKKAVGDTGKNIDKATNDAKSWIKKQLDKAK